MEQASQIDQQSASPRQVGEIRGFLQRLCYALGPLGVGIVLDVLDFATFGPIGIFAGAIVGGYAGWVLGEYEGFDRNYRIAFALCAAAYMMMPFTEFVPAATIISLFVRFFDGPRNRKRAAAGSMDTESNTGSSD